ncbi:hypothetical protein FALCPG4_015695 [Fusarium falciforme]
MPANMEDMSMPLKSDERIRRLILLFERMDDHLIETAREALQHQADPSGPDHSPLPISEIDLRLIEAARQSYHTSQFNTDEMKNYFSAFPDFEALWTNVSRTILRYFQGTVRDRQGEWRVWLSRVQGAGKQTWQQAYEASYPLSHPGPAAAIINAIIDKLRLVDILLDEIHSGLYREEDEKREHFSSELEDTLLATIDINRRGGDLTAESIANFKAAIRVRRAAERARYSYSTSIDTGTGDSEVTSSYRGSSTANPATPNPRNHADNRTSNGDSGSLFSRPDTSAAHYNKYDPTTFALVVIITIAAAGLTAKGWNLSPHEPGRRDDPDFWFLLQSSLMQLASMVPIIFCLLVADSTSLQPRLWSWVFLGSGILFALLAPLLYLVVPTELSAMISFCGSVAQVLIVLEAMFLAGRVSAGGAMRSDVNKDR